jgi:hypothetical protein
VPSDSGTRPERTQRRTVAGGDVDPAGDVRGGDLGH